MVTPIVDKPPTLNPVKRGREFLHTPGPTNIPDRILNAMHRPAMDFASPAFFEMAAKLFEDLKGVFGTSSEVFLYTASGHGGWEGAFVNCFSPGDTLLLPETGRFARVWGEMAERLGYKLEHVPGDWRTPIDVSAIEDKLSRDKEHRIKGVLAVQVETATGAWSDIKGIRQAIDAANHPALLIVDAIASFACVPLPMEEWGVDVTIAASQKGLMCPPGLGFCAVSEKALAASYESRSQMEYFSWPQRMKRESYSRFCGTAPEHLIFGLAEAIKMLEEEGWENVFARHTRLATAVRKTVEVWSEAGALEFNTLPPESRADSLTVVRTPEGMDSEIVRRTARDTFGVAVGGSLGDLANRVFRIGHMGDLNEPMILGALGGVEAALQVCQVPIGKGGVGAAVDYLASTAHI
ncbi:MAG TPA: aminotransferase class V-fold PLP-dependent enzyme [Alphaproteobacteria bacterium]|nr:aminotransferase class V-fold PLP-dependent enzyme [Alphaproteobacteria bacterium]